jgi:hypothetical protein
MGAISFLPLRSFVFPRCNVVKNSPDDVWFQKHLEFHCDDCGSDTAFRSRRRSFSEHFLLPVFLLQPVRCAECFRRSYRLIFMPVKERLAEAIAKQPASVARSGGSRNVA